jgi:hypothetical protein
LVIGLDGNELGHCIAPALVAAAAFLGLAEVHDRRALGMGGAIAGLALGAGHGALAERLRAGLRGALVTVT